MNLNNHLSFYNLFGLGRLPRVTMQVEPTRVA